jgi:hypothetical protein
VFSVAEELWEFVSGEKSVMLFLTRRKGTGQIWGRVIISPASNNGVPPHLTATLSHLPEFLCCASLIQLRENGQELHWFDISDRASPDYRENVGLKGFHHLFAVGLRPAVNALAVPLAGDRLKGVFVATLLRQLNFFADIAGINATSYLLAGIIAFEPGIIQGYIGIVPSEIILGLPSKR